jgi:hypothetical protein
MRDGFYRAGFIALLASTAFLLGVLHSGGLPARAEGGTTVPAGGGGGGGATADGNRDMIAVTGTSPTGAAVLYLVDTKGKRIAVYQASGKNIELVAARNIEYDLKLDAWHDSSPEEVQVRRLRADWQKQQQGGGGGDGR